MFAHVRAICIVYSHFGNGSFYIYRNGGFLIISVKYAHCPIGHLGKILITVMEFCRYSWAWSTMDSWKEIKTYTWILFFFSLLLSFCRNCCKTLSRRKLSKPEDQASNIRNPAGCRLHKTVRASIHSSISSSWGFFLPNASAEF